MLELEEVKVEEEENFIHPFNNQGNKSHVISHSFTIPDNPASQLRSTKSHIFETSGIKKMTMEEEAEEVSCNDHYEFY